MTVDVRQLLEGTGALLAGHFRLSSGLHSGGYVQCARLLEHPRHARAIGEALAARISVLGAVKIVSPALGGVIIGYVVAQALDRPFVFTERKEGRMVLRRGFQLDPGERIVIVEDVVTTGKSTRETGEAIGEQGGIVVGFASILNRSGKDNPFEAPYEALLRLDFETFEESACPYCAEAIPLEAPGSRFSHGA